MEKEIKESLNKRVALIKIPEKTKHIFLCTGPKCCQKEDGMKVWERLKERTRENELSHVNRSKVDCLRLCEHGPIALVYPDGSWYAQMDAQAIDRVLDEHIKQGKVVEDHLVCTNTLEGAAFFSKK